MMPAPVPISRLTFLTGKLAGVFVSQNWPGGGGGSFAEHPLPGWEVRLDGGQLTASPFRLVGPGTDVQIESAYDIEADLIHARANGLMDLGLLTAALPEVRARGGVRVDVVAEGALAGPSVEGWLEAQDGRLRWLGFPQSVDGLRGRFGNGEIRAEGRATLAGIGLESFLVELEVANVRVAYPEGFRGIYEGRVSLESSDEQLKLGGDLTLLLGVYDKEFDLTGQTARPYAVPDDSRLPENVQLDLRVVAGGHGTTVDARRGKARLPRRRVSPHVG